MQLDENKQLQVDNFQIDSETNYQAYPDSLDAMEVLS